MSKMRMWNDHKTKDYMFVDKILKSYFQTSGTKVYIHKLVGYYDKDGNTVADKIQDKLFMENRDRYYSPEVYEDYAVYTMSDSDFELSAFGLFNIDTIFVDFHLNAHVDLIGRKLAAGDVLELVHLRDDMLEGREGAMNAFYVVEEAKRSAEGYDAKWLPHIWRTRIKKLNGSKEYNDVFENSDTSIDTLMAQYNNLISNNEALVEEAEAEVPSKASSNDYEYDYRFKDALEPEAGLDLESLPRLVTFPVDAEEGDHVIRVDYDPHQVFRRTDGKWVLVNITHLLRKWSRGHDVQTSFVENNVKTEVDGVVRAERTYITRPVDLPLDDQ